MKPAHQRLDELMRDRRFVLGMRTWRALSERAGISYETLRAVRAGGNPGEATADGLERALRWQPGSIRAILAGGEPTTYVEAADRQALERDYQDPAVAKLAQRLERQEQTTARLAKENTELRRMFKEISGKPSATAGGEEPETDAPHQAM